MNPRQSLSLGKRIDGGSKMFKVLLILVFFLRKCSIFWYKVSGWGENRVDLMGGVGQEELFRGPF